MTKKNVSPLRYPGGKTRACKILEEILNKKFELKNFDTILSPFFGGGSFEFYIQNKYNMHIVANDKFIPLYSFWNSVKTSQNKLCKELYEELDCVTKEQFTKYRKDVINENK